MSVLNGTFVKTRIFQTARRAGQAMETPENGNRGGESQEETREGRPEIGRPFAREMSDDARDGAAPDVSE